VMPISQLVVNVIGFLLQFGLFLFFYVVYYFKGAPIHMGWQILLLPLLIIQMAALGLGFGCIVSAMTTRFRDLQVLLGFFIQLWMYASCVVYPLSAVPESWRWLFMLNPMVFVIEAFRFAFMGQGTVTAFQIVLSSALSIVTLLVGVLMFNRVERNSVDNA